MCLMTGSVIGGITETLPIKPHFIHKTVKILFHFYFGAFFQVINAITGQIFYDDVTDAFASRQARKYQILDGSLHVLYLKCNSVIFKMSCL